MYAIWKWIAVDLDIRKDSYESDHRDWSGRGLLFQSKRCAFWSRNHRDREDVVHAVDPDWEIGLGFVACLFRVCKRAGEAQLCGRVREWRFPTQVFRMVRCDPAQGPAVIAAFHVCCYVQSFIWVFRADSCYVHGVVECVSFCCHDRMCIVFLTVVGRGNT